MKKFFESICESIIIFIMVIYAVAFFSICKLFGVNLEDDFI